MQPTLTGCMSAKNLYHSIGEVHQFTASDEGSLQYQYAATGNVCEGAEHPAPDRALMTVVSGHGAKKDCRAGRFIPRPVRIEIFPFIRFQRSRRFRVC